jgi:hypothetical protein
MIRRKTVVLVAVVAAFGWALGASAQNADGGSPVATALPVIGFTFDFPQSSPDHYSITVDAAGNATYVSGEQAKSSDDADQSFHYEFKLSDPTRTQVLELAKRANYFQGALEHGKGKIANTGMKTLTYNDGQKKNSATFNYSNNPAAQELTRIFQSVSATIEFGERLEHFHRYQKLALDEELKRMDEMVKGNGLMEIQAVAPILKQIVADQSVVNATRARAERILATLTRSGR